MNINVSQSCSWCNELNDVTAPPVFCRSCGHRADVARMFCNCEHCTQNTVRHLYSVLFGKQMPEAVYSVLFGKQMPEAESERNITMPINKDEALAAVIHERLVDYYRKSPTEERAELIALWREHHPEAANEVSSVYKPLIQVDVREKGDSPDDPDEQWTNDTYFVTLRRRPDRVFKTERGMIQLGISALSGTARHDWREFQAIKNQLAGPECEAFELYPAEARLLDPSNYYTMWCFPGIRRIAVGKDVRDVRQADDAIAPQRAFPKREFT